MDTMGMSDLQISLVVIGGAVVVGVALFNWVQQRRFRRSAEEAFGHKHEDVLLEPDVSIEEGGRIEPQLGKEVLQEFQTEMSVGIAEQGIDAGEAAEFPQADATPKVAVPILAEQKAIEAGGAGGIDYIVNIQSDALIAPSGLTAVLLRKFDFGKPVHWLGQRDSGASWEEITVEINEGGGGYTKLKGCLQMVDRSGPVSEVNLSEFFDMVKNFSTHMNAIADLPDIRHAHAQAVALDQFCAEVDVMVSINIISKDGGAFTGTKIHALAEASGLKLETEGAFSYRDESGAVLFSLNNFDSAPFLPDNMRTFTTHGVTFLLDVPRVKNGERVFDQMMHLAGIFSTTLGGMLVDDNRISLTDSGIVKIKQHLGSMQDMMRARNILAGGEISLRLFA
ncbi:MAG: cell division protein ZipA C-terminal FtsZ-binding domain-containing protein [Nitrosospira sp.]|nr:cell division protein ZipA C-terminal FtsZ-binding domain-containing protein [Nitrosospira sp.]MBI0409369.1 cell division protein ZipA C-terminal FtsZ-binding domain-containing protein [Nitrosospira sp.]MBI0410866.1 cell division protein ZipA C-terminal FtsZ-binding domain-containing protein [Nitrosospira sp.]MBI0411134.1 cell division protein ZipA C-terminal FtsZ-binding domain-containing protein [Nitrosospira sp.]MBI0420720.1 cell division protein ZipA C-terminal FtsZ-binding domain-contai